MDHLICEDRGGASSDHGRSMDDDRAEALGFVGVGHRYGDRVAVDDVSIAVGAGEIVCLCGPSGCGKSTLLRIAAGLETLQRGTVRLGGAVVAGPGRSLPPERRGVGLVFQDYALFPHLSVADNVQFGLRGVPGGERRSRSLAVLDQVGMVAYADAFPHQLSGGQQQRAALARALAPNPAVLLLDEPFSGLDARLREQVRDETLQVLKRNGAATLLVTHDSEEAMFLADRIALMRGGKVVQSGAPSDLYSRPMDGFAAAFFGEVNALHGVVSHGRVSTALGEVPARHGGDGTPIAEGTIVEVLVRPEALRPVAADHLAADHLAADNHGAGIRDGMPSGESVSGLPVLARVISARLVGPASLLHVVINAPKDGRTHLRARVPGEYLPEEGGVVSLTLDGRGVFVYPAAE